MENKISKIFVALFSLLVLASSVSAAVFSFETLNQPTSLLHNSGSFLTSYNITYTGTDASGIDVAFTSASLSNGATLVTPSTYHLDTNQSKIVEFVFNYPSYVAGSISGTLTADPSGSAASVSKSFSIPINSTDSYQLSWKDKNILLIKNTGNTNLNLNLNSQGALPVQLSSTSVIVPANSQKEITVSSTKNISDLTFGTTSAKIYANLSTTYSQSIDYSLVKGFCEFGNNAKNLSISNIDITNLGNGEEDEWNLLDTIEVEVELENKDDDERLRNVYLELALFDSSGKDISGDLVFFNEDDEKIKIGTLREDDSITETFKFKVPADFDDGTYKLAVKAYVDGENECDDDSADFSDSIFNSIEITRNDDPETFLKIDNVEISPTDITCNENVQLNFNVVNTGDEDIEDQFRVIIRNAKLNLELIKDIKKDLDMGDSEEISVFFTMPQVVDGDYHLEIWTEHDYDKKKDNYKEQSDEPEIVSIKVIGCAVIPSNVANAATINAKLSSEAKAGEELVIVSTISNIADSEKTFKLTVEDYDSWAELVSVSESEFTLDKEESTEVTLTFKVKSDASGTNKFSIETKTGSEIDSREISVKIAEKSRFSFDFSKLLEGNALLWTIGIVNIVLILLIIIVAIKVSSR
jgi:hypothetical protein